VCVFRVVGGKLVTSLWEKAESYVMEKEAATLTSDCNQERIVSGQSLRNHSTGRCLVWVNGHRRRPGTYF